MTERARYVLPGDVVRVGFSIERTLDGDFPVDEQGEVVLPLVGSVDVGGRPVDVLTIELRAAYANVIRNQAVQIQFLHRVSVLGSVANPGLYHADGTMTVREVVALAGGVEEDGKREVVELTRKGAQASTLVSPDRYALEVIRSGDALTVPQRSWLSRNSVVVFSSVVSAIAIVASRSWVR